MSRVFDDLQALQRKLAARQSGFAPLPATTPAKEVPPMGSGDNEHPPLDRTGLREGYMLCVGNATRFIADARLLRDAGRLRSAYLILSLALEELGAALQLYEAGSSGVGDWDAWWRRYWTHPRKLASPALDLPRMEEAGGRFTLVREELVYVDFDTKHERFTGPREDDDSDLHELFEVEAAYADTLLNALPTHAFERWEFEEIVEHSPEMAPSILYALVEKTVSEEPAVSERELLSAIARDLGMPPDQFAAGYQRWKNAAPKARMYLDVLRRVQDSLKKEREAKGTG
jgi:AbiV